MSDTRSAPRQLLDWRFFLSLALLLAIVYVVGTGILAQHDRHQQTARIRVLVDRLQAQQEHNSANTATFAANQRAMLAYTAALANHQADLVVYLHRHGVKIPQHFLAPIPPPSLTSTNTPGEFGDRFGGTQQVIPGELLVPKANAHASAKGKEHSTKRHHRHRHRSTPASRTM